MMLFEKLYKALASLNIPIVNGSYHGDSKSYCIVSICREVEYNSSSNTNKSELNKLKLIYWHDVNEEDKSVASKFLMCGLGFRFTNATNLHNEGYLGKELEFQHIRR